MLCQGDGQAGGRNAEHIAIVDGARCCQRCPRQHVAGGQRVKDCGVRQRAPVATAALVAVVVVPMMVIVPVTLRA